MRDTVTRTRNAAAGAPALAIAALAIIAIAAAWTLEARGYVPCELCLKERFPYYAGIPVALIVGIVGARLPRPILRAAYGLLGIVFAFGAVLGAYHAGVEWKLWAGPGECSGGMAAPAAVADFLKQLKTVEIVRCDEPALRVEGVSLAAWNALLSVVLAGLAMLGWQRSA